MDRQEIDKFLFILFHFVYSPSLQCIENACALL